MSAIALVWVASIKVGNQTAKQLLQFYAAHNFNKPGFEFSNEILANQLEVTVRSIQRAHELLIDKNFIKREKRYSKTGRELTPITYLDIPQEFVDKFMGGAGHKVTLRDDIKSGKGDIKSSLNNKYNNKTNNKKLLYNKRSNKDQNIDTSIPKNKSFYRKQNEEKHDFAENMNQKASAIRHESKNKKYKHDAFPQEIRDKLGLKMKTTHKPPNFV